MRDVTETSGASRQVIARIVTELSVDGYLSVTVDPRDRRNQMLRFTPLGRRLARASITAGKRVEAAMAEAPGRPGRQPAPWTASDPDRAPGDNVLLRPGIATVCDG